MAYATQLMSDSACLNVENRWYGGDAMTGKKDMDATKHLPESEPTQVTPKGQKIGLPRRKEVFDALAKVIKKPT